MALVKELSRMSLQRNVVHEPVECTYTTFEKNGTKYLQIDTYGKKTRKNPGKKSQTLQFDEESLRALINIIKTNIF